MIATQLTTPGAQHSSNDLSWLHAAADRNAWLEALAKPDHFSHSTAGPQRTASAFVSSSSSGPATPKLTLKLPKHAAKRWPSARSEAQPWDAAWLAQDASDYSEDEDEEDESRSGSTTPTLPILRRKSAADAPRSGKQVHLAPSRPAVLDLTPAAQGAYMRPYETSEASLTHNERSSQSVPPSPTVARRRRRHQRTISAPGQPGLAPLSAAPLHVDTALPLALPPRSIYAAASREDAEPIDTSMLAQASSLALQRTNSVASMGSSICSDGSWHGDVGDEDPDAQLEAANARLGVASGSSSRRQSVSQVNAFSASPISSKPRAFSFSSVSGSSDDEEAHAISACAGPLAAALANLLDLSALGITTPRAKRTRRPSRGRALTEPYKASQSTPLSMVDRRSSSADGQKYAYSTPASLRAEGKGLRYRRQAPQPNALTRLGSWLVGAEAAEPESPRMSRSRSRMLSATSDDSVPPSPSTSMLLLPSLLSRSSSVASLGSLATLPALTHDASSDSSDSEDGETDAGESLADAARVRTAWKTHGGQPGAGAVKLATSHRRAALAKRRHAPAGLSFTPLQSSISSSAKEMRQPAPVSPLWCEDADDDEPTNLPYSRSWVSLLGL